MTQPNQSQLDARRGGIRCARLLGLVLLFAAALALAGGCGSCSDASDDEEASEEVAEEDEADEPSAAERMIDRREVYGLPLPPSVIHIKDEGRKVRVQTDMTLSELEDYFKARLTDYELLNPGHRIRAVGLRDYMAHLYAYRYGNRSIVVYMPPSSDDGGGDDSARAQDESDEKSNRASARNSGSSRRKAGTSSRGTKPISKRKKGEPVRDRNDDGELIAPGARWGEPYTPPEGSPLHQKRFESNFGKPYGEWVPQ